MPPLTFLDASDSPPSRDDPPFRDDYAAYRKVYKAWHERERTRRKIAQPQHASDAATQPAAVQQEEATPVKRRRMLPRPRRTDFDTEEDLEDAMAARVVCKPGIDELRNAIIDEERQLVVGEAVKYDRRFRLALRDDVDGHVSWRAVGAQEGTDGVAMAVARDNLAPSTVGPHECA